VGRGLDRDNVVLAVAKERVGAYSLDNLAPSVLSKASELASIAGLSIETALLQQGGEWLVSNFGTYKIADIPTIDWGTTIVAAAAEGGGVLAVPWAAALAVGVDVLLQPTVLQDPSVPLSFGYQEGSSCAGTSTCGGK